jgi:hypothetical protein
VYANQLATLLDEGKAGYWDEDRNFLITERTEAKKAIIFRQQQDASGFKLKVVVSMNLGSATSTTTADLSKNIAAGACRSFSSSFRHITHCRALRG